jgi:hypothetical protein
MLRRALACEKCPLLTRSADAPKIDPRSREQQRSPIRGRTPTPCKDALRSRTRSGSRRGPAPSSALEDSLVQTRPLRAVRPVTAFPPFNLCLHAVGCDQPTAAFTRKDRNDGQRVAVIWIDVTETPSPADLTARSSSPSVIHGTRCRYNPSSSTTPFGSSVARLRPTIFTLTPLN